MLSLKGLTNASVVILNNTFTNISTHGPLIYVEDSTSEIDTAVVIARNVFSLILTYRGPAVLQIKRSFSNMLVPIVRSFYGLSSEERYARAGGGILILNNSFSMIAPCPYVVSNSLIVIMVNEINFLNSYITDILKTIT